MNAVQPEARSRVHSRLSGTRTGKAWSFGGGVNGRGRTGKERAAHTRHGGETEKYRGMFNSHNYLFTSLLVYFRGAFTALRATSSSVSGESFVSSARRGGGLTLSHRHWTSRQDTAQAKRDTKKRGTTSVVKRRGHTPAVHFWAEKRSHCPPAEGEQRQVC